MVQVFKVVIQPEMKILPLFTHSHVSNTIYGFKTQFKKKEFLVTLFNLLKINDWDCKRKNDKKAR